MFFTIFGAVLALSPCSVFKNKYFRVLYQTYTVIWSFSVLLIQIHVYFQRRNLVLLQKFMFVLLSVCKVFLDVSVTLLLWRRSSTLLKLLKFLIEAWVSKFVVLWMFSTLAVDVLAASIITPSWPIAAVFCFFLRQNGALIGLSLLVTLTKNRVKKFNLQVRKSREVDLPSLLQLQKKLFSLIDCLNCMFGAVMFWTILTAICLVLDYFSFTISTYDHSKDYLNILGYYSEVIYFEVHVCALITCANQLDDEIKKMLCTCFDRSLQNPEGNFAFAIAQQVYVKQPRLSAWGFFDVDNSTFVFAICAILNYAIVLCQTVAR